MNDYLTTLILTNLNLTPTLQPRVAALFEPAASGNYNAGEREMYKDVRNETGAPAPPMPRVVVERDTRNRAGSRVRADSPNPDVERTPRIQAEAPTPSRVVSEPSAEPSASTSDVPRAVVVRPQVKTIVEAAPIGRELTAPQTSADRPVIRVTIGRVDVRAVQSPTPISPKKKDESPKMPLDEFLKRRER